MGKTYQTIQIGPQCWMAENLDVGVMVNGLNDMLDNDTIEKYCYDDDTINCEVYGGLYQWDELMNYTTDKQGICPDGWRISTFNDWSLLDIYLAGTSPSDTIYSGGKLKEIGYDHWKEPNKGATNSSGFTAVAGGVRTVMGNFINLNEFGEFWTSDEQDNETGFNWMLSYNSSTPGFGPRDKRFGLSIRCIKQ